MKPDPEQEISAIVRDIRRLAGMPLIDATLYADEPVTVRLKRAKAIQAALTKHIAAAQTARREAETA